ncbi:MAG: hypothetical protein V4448_16365 [Pseudomonadota bacterium]
MFLSWEVHQELSKLLMDRQNAKEIKQLDGPLKNWAIFYGKSQIKQESGRWKVKKIQE